MLNYEQMYRKLVTGAKLMPEGVPEMIPYGDMPGDKIEIGEVHVKKAKIIFEQLLKVMAAVVRETKNNKIVVTVCGGSGVGKSETASLLSAFLVSAGIGSYTLSGDNYPHRIPKYNDAERLCVFRKSALAGMLKDDQYSSERAAIIKEMQAADTDADVKLVDQYPWYQTYLDAGRQGLTEYLGTEREINFPELTGILAQFKSGAEKIWLKRMGRELSEIWYEQVDFTDTNVLIIEWTHGNSDHYQGVDIPILLNSTPEETLAHRKARNRDGAIDSPFTTLVLAIEQEKLQQQAKKARLIVSKEGQLLSYEEYQKQMNNEGARS